MYSLAQILCLFCGTIGSPPYAPMPQQSMDIWYRHEVLSRGRHLLRLSNTDLLLDSKAARQYRLQAFAADVASRTCPGPFAFVDGDRLTSYATQIVFQCR
jgi:hypothetical protein